MKKNNMPAYKLSCATADGKEFVVFASSIYRAVTIARKKYGYNFTITDFTAINPVVNMTIYE